MCGGGGDSAPIDMYQGPPGPGTGIAGVPIGTGNYQDAARSLLSVGQTYGQLAAQAADNVAQNMPVAAPPAPQSAFQGGIGQYLAAGGASPAPGMSPDIQALEAGYDPRTSATEMLEGYESAFEPRPLSYYTPNAMEQMEEAAKRAEEEAARAAQQGGSSRQRNGGGRDGGGGESIAVNRGGGPSYRGLGDMFDGGGPQASTIGGRDFQGPNPDGSAGNDGPRGGFGGLLGGLF